MKEMLLHLLTCLLQLGAGQGSASGIKALVQAKACCQGTQVQGTQALRDTQVKL